MGALRSALIQGTDAVLPHTRRLLELAPKGSAPLYPRDIKQHPPALATVTFSRARILNVYVRALEGYTWTLPYLII